jgi:adenylate cyclase
MSGALIVGMGSLLLAPQQRALELSLATFAQELRGRRNPPGNISIVAIDDFSLQQAANADLSSDPALQTLRDWPWPRAIYGLLLDRLYDAGASSVAVDLLFDAPSSHGSRDDRRLAGVLGRYRPRTLLGAQVLESRGDVAGLSLSLPVVPLQAAAGASTAGLLNGPLDADGVIRKRPGDYADQLRSDLGPSVPPSLGQVLLRAGGHLDLSRMVPPLGRWLPLLDFYGPPRTISTVSIWAILESGSFRHLKDSGRFRDQMVLIGPTASVLQDLHRTAFSRAEGMPGVEVHATELANRMEGRTLWFWQPPDWWSLLLAFCAFMAALLAQRWDKPLIRLSVLAGLAVSFAVLSLLLIGVAGLALPLFTVAGTILLMGVVTSSDATLRLQWQRRRLRLALGRYLSPAVAAEISDQPAKADGILGGRSARVVILMTDIRGFTARTLKMTEENRVADLVNQLNQYFGEVVDSIDREGGIVDKFIGDATLAVFGAPVSRGDGIEAASALRAALRIRQRLCDLNSRWVGEGKEPWQQVIVLNFGTVISGNIGSSQRMDYTVIGDAVNTTSRLEAVAKQCNRDLVMSGSFVGLIDPSAVRCEHLGDFELRGHGIESAYGLPDSGLMSDGRANASADRGI